MLIIRDDQMAAFRAEQDRAFAREVVPRLRRAFPELTTGAPDGPIEAWVTDALRRARGQGLTAGFDLTRFVVGAFPGEFPRTPPA